MARFKIIKQIVLLSQKNLKIRFSHRCLSFWELGLPLILAAFLGIFISYYDTSPMRDHRSMELTENRRETWYSINNAKDLEEIKLMNILYLTSDVDSPQSKQLVEAVMENVLKVGVAQEGNETLRLQTNWRKSSMTEDELEICIFHLDPNCKGIHAAVIFTTVQDKVHKMNEILVEYKIRVVLEKFDGRLLYLRERLYAEYNFREFLRTVDALEEEYFCLRLKYKYYIQHDIDECEGKAFAVIQFLLDQGITEYIKTTKRGNVKSEEVQLSLVRMPFRVPRYYARDRLVISKFLSLLLSLLFSLIIFSSMQVNSEKCSGFKELLCMHGISSWTQWMAWLFSSFLVYSILTALFCLLVSLPFPGAKGTNLIPRLGISGILCWLLLLLFVMSVTTYSFLVSVFFEKVWTAACIGLVTWIMLNIFMLVFSLSISSPGMGATLAGMLVPPVALSCALQLMFNYGGTFETMSHPVIDDLPVALIHCLFMLMLDSCIFMALAMYLDNVLPSKYGIRKPGLYFLWNLRKFMRSMRRGVDYRKVRKNNQDDEEGVEMLADMSQDFQQPFEPGPENSVAAVVVRNLKKVFAWNKKRAVDGLSVKMFTGEIFALLGFNGAGKTTTIGILTGLTNPTDGEAHIFDLDIKTEMEEIRKYIGLCPQHNLLSNEMSVLDQVTFFGKLKGLDNPRAKAKELMNFLDMPDKLHSKPEQLSGGQKRRVQMAIALIGDTKLAFLDEPTSGLDPESSREVWKILLKLRGKMTLVLTTHAMQEADVLADRIGIMSEGKMMCCGTPSFLKKYYGVGYNLKITLNSSLCAAEMPEKLCNFAKKYVPNANLNDPEGSPLQNNLFCISLPGGNLNLSLVADLMDALNEGKEQWHIENICLSESSMDEVFQKVGEAVQAVTTISPESTSTAPQNAFLSKSFSDYRYVGPELQWYRYKTLLFKRMLYFVSASFTLLLLVLFFMVALWIILTWISFKVYTPLKPDPPRVVSSSSLEYYQHPTILFHDATNRINSSVDTSYKSSYKSQFYLSETKFEEFSKNTFQEMMSSLEKVKSANFSHFRQNYLVGASFNRSSTHNKSSPLNIAGFFSAYALHSAPLSLNLISQTMIKETTGVDAKINVVNHPLHSYYSYSSINSRYWIYSGVSILGKLGAVLLLGIVNSLLTSTAALLPTDERLSKGKQLQLMTGTTPFTYWMAMFTWDFFFFSLLNLLIIATCVLVDYSSGNWLLTNNGAGAVLYLILECHLFAALWFSYFLSSLQFIKHAYGGFIVINVVAFIVGLVWNVIRLVVLFDLAKGYREESDIYKYPALYNFCIYSGYAFSLVPTYSLFQGILKLVTISFPNSMCNWFPAQVLSLACQNTWKFQEHVDSVSEIPFLFTCCSNCREKCFTPQSHFVTSNISVFPEEAFYRPRRESHALVFDMLLLVLCGVVWAVVLFSMEYLPLVIRARQPTAEVSGEDPEDTTVDGDNDVANEVTRVRGILRMNDNMGEVNHALVVHNLHLKFGKLETIKKGLSFAVHPGECFGLLGVNAAGKTSLFQILTGAILPSAGNMYSGGVDYYKDRTYYLSSIGYCPQFDAIIGALTGLQMVKLYGALRGIPPERLDEDAKLWLDKFGLLASANKKCAEYSGGMKRRLSVAMALIGNPKLLLLDEPTTGVDPVFRRQFWKVIREVQGRGQSVVLTSHTMDECEALCDRLGIMVDGQFKCLDNADNLQRKYGYILSLKLNKNIVEEGQEGNVQNLFEKMVHEFSPCRVHSKQRFFVQYKILNTSLWYSNIYRTMEQIRTFPEFDQLIEEYSVTQISLEDVFLSLVSKSDGN